MTKVIIVRHCQAEGNLKRFFQGKIDTDITPHGKKQIGQAAELLSREPIEEIYCSPLLRARKTAEGINIYHELPIHIENSLIEINAGEWEGKFLKDLEKMYPEQYYNWYNNPSVFKAPGGESMEQVYERVKKAILKIVLENKNKTVCIVSHGCAIRNMMCFAHGLEISDIKNISIGTNLSVNVVCFDDDLKPTVIVDNYTDHLQ